jgi:hypothetical protein
VSKTNIVLVNLSLLERKKFAGYKKKMKDNNFYRKINKQKLEFYFVTCTLKRKRNVDPYIAFFDASLRGRMAGKSGLVLTTTIGYNYY